MICDNHDLKEFLSDIKTYKGSSLYDLSMESPILVVFLRHFGCIFCRESLQDLAKKQAQLSLKGIKLVFVHMSDDQTAASYFEEYGIEDYNSISDPACEIYSQFGLTKGSFNQLFGLQVMLRGIQSMVKERTAFSIKQIGDGFQMPGIFLLNKGKVEDSYIHKKASDRPDYDILISCCAA